MDLNSIIANMLTRHLAPHLIDALAHSPAVVLLGPRQAGKTTLALAIARGQNAIYLDLESEQDRAKLAQLELYLADHQDKLIIIDEVHRAPGLFPVLRGLIDRSRRSRTTQRPLPVARLRVSRPAQAVRRNSRRARCLPGTRPVPCFGNRRDILPTTLWVRGGFPESLLAADDRRSLRWRQDFIRTYLERDIPQFGPRIAAETLRRFWIMLAHHQGGCSTPPSSPAASGSMSKPSQDTSICSSICCWCRRLRPWHANQGKRLVKSPKVYVRDSGLVHALLGVPDKEALLAHPVAGQSWECFVIENLIAAAPADVQGYFYRTGGGAEIDLLLAWPDGRLWAIEVKRSLNPRVERGFHVACEDLVPARKLVVYPGADRFRLAPDIEAVPLGDLMKELSATGYTDA